MAYDNTNTLKIWKVQKRNPKEPDYKIDVNFNGQEFQIPLWKRKDDANPNGPIFNGKIEPGRITTGPQPRNNDLDDEVPF